VTREDRARARQMIDTLADHLAERTGPGWEEAS
jgi:hypothetical protein